MTRVPVGQGQFDTFQEIEPKSCDLSVQKPRYDVQPSSQCATQTEHAMHGDNAQGNTMQEEGAGVRGGVRAARGADVVAGAAGGAGTLQG